MAVLQEYAISILSFDICHLPRIRLCRSGPKKTSSCVYIEDGSCVYIEDENGCNSEVQTVAVEGMYSLADAASTPARRHHELPPLCLYIKA